MADANTDAESVSKTKLNIGPLPKQLDDHKKYEETEILWGRVALAGGLAVLMLVLLLTWLLGGFDSPEQAKEPRPQISQNTHSPSSDSASEPELPIFEKDAKPAKPAEVEQAIAKALESTTQKEDVKPSSDPVEQAFKEASAVKQTSVAKQPKPLVAQVELLHPGIRKLLLRHTLADGKPQPPFGYQVAMPEEGIIKVILDAQMQGLKGKVTFHEWYRGEQRLARVKIPVNVAKQSSYSSKFVNQQMRGDWIVKIVDEGNQLLAQARFRVE